MSNIRCLFLSVFCVVISACGTMQSIVRSSLPYTSTLSLPASAGTGTTLVSMGVASSIDQYFFASGNASNRINAVKVVSAELKAALPADLDLGHLQWVKIYMVKSDGSAAVLVASKTDIKADAGNIINLDTDNSAFLDRFIREPEVKIKMEYKLRSKITTDANLLLVLQLNATPVKQ